MRVEITCSDPALAFRGEWAGPEDPQQLVERLVARARRLGIPIQVAVEGHGAWSIAPTGKVIRGSLFDEAKLRGSGRRRRPPRP